MCYYRYYCDYCWYCVVGKVHLLTLTWIPLRMSWGVVVLSEGTCRLARYHQPSDIWLTAGSLEGTMPYQTPYGRPKPALLRLLIIWLDRSLCQLWSSNDFSWLFRVGILYGPFFHVSLNGEIIYGGLTCLVFRLLHSLQRIFNENLIINITRFHFHFFKFWNWIVKFSHRKPGIHSLCSKEV